MAWGPLAPRCEVQTPHVPPQMLGTSVCPVAQMLPLLPRGLCAAVWRPGQWCPVSYLLREPSPTFLPHITSRQDPGHLWFLPP